MMFVWLLFISVLFLRLCHSQNTCSCSNYVKIEEECKKYISQTDCLPQKEIMGGIGRVSDITQWPYLVSLQYPIGGDCFYHFCAGVLIAPNLVLTAAHCFDRYVVDGGEGNGSSLIEEFYASLAPPCRHLSSGRTQDFQGRALVDLMYISPEWARDEASGDVAVAVLDRQMPPPYLNFQREIQEISSRLTVAGWGAFNVIEAAQPLLYISRQLYEGDLVYISEVLCELFLSGSPEAVSMVNYSTMLCAYNPQSDTCGGDSGGPIVIKGVTPSEDMLVGIASWGPRTQCQSEDSAQAPVIMARVSVFADWIDTIIQQYKQVQLQPTITSQTFVNQSVQMNIIKPDIP